MMKSPLKFLFVAFYDSVAQNVKFMFRRGLHLDISLHIDNNYGLRSKQRPFHHSAGHKLENDV